MTINPFWSLGGAGAGAGATGAAGAGAAAGFPWLELLPIIISLFGSLGIGEESEEEKQQKQMWEMQQNLKKLGLKAPYQSPFLKQIDPVMARVLLGNVQRSGNWGWPAGQGIDMSFIEDLLGGGGLGGGLNTGGLGGILRKK